MIFLKRKALNCPRKPPEFYDYKRSRISKNPSVRTMDMGWTGRGGGWPRLNFLRGLIFYYFFRGKNQIMRLNIWTWGGGGLRGSANVLTFIYENKLYKKKRTSTMVSTCNVIFFCRVKAEKCWKFNRVDKVENLGVKIKKKKQLSWNKF